LHASCSGGNLTNFTAGKGCKRDKRRPDLGTKTTSFRCQ